MRISRAQKYYAIAKCNHRICTAATGKRILSTNLLYRFRLFAKHVREREERSVFRRREGLYSLPETVTAGNGRQQQDKDAPDGGTGAADAQDDRVYDGARHHHRFAS